MPSVKPKNHRDPVVSGYPTSLPSKRLAAKSFQIDLGDTDTGGLLLASGVRLLLFGQGEQVHLADNASHSVQTFFDGLERESSTKVQKARKPLQKKMQTLSPQLEELS